MTYARDNSIDNDDASTKEVYEQRDRVKSLLDGLCNEYNPTKGEWIMSQTAPSALDAYLMACLARLADAGNVELIPEGLRGYLCSRRESDEWRMVMDGRSTLH